MINHELKKIIKERLLLLFVFEDRKSLWIKWGILTVWALLLSSYCLSLISASAGGYGSYDVLTAYSASVPNLEPLDCKSAILMEAKTGTVLYEQNADQPLPPASVTKIMTLLIVMEAIEKGSLTFDDMLRVSENAASMGGSQIFLEPGETMSVDDLIKSVVIASANDAAVVLAEAIAGSEAAFVELMNKRAEELGMLNTHFENTNGLDDTVVNHVLSARDIAIMSRELISHQKILEYSSIWMDTVRDGEFGLTNTNRLVRFYSGATGLKTGSTSKAKFCISATAQRDGMHLIAVIMASPTRDARNAAAAKLLDWGFANYSLFSFDGESRELPLLGACDDVIKIGAQNYSVLVPKGMSGKVEVHTEIPDAVSAPINKEETVGKIKFILDGETIGESNFAAMESAQRISFMELLADMVKKFFLC